MAAAVAEAIEAPVSDLGGNKSAGPGTLLSGSLGVIVGRSPPDPPVGEGLPLELETGGGVALVSLDDEVDEPVLLAAAVAAGGVPE